MRNNITPEAKDLDLLVCREKNHSFLKVFFVIIATLSVLTLATQAKKLFTKGAPLTPFVITGVDGKPIETNNEINYDINTNPKFEGTSNKPGTIISIYAQGTKIEEKLIRKATESSDFNLGYHSPFENTPDYYKEDFENPSLSIMELSENTIGKGMTDIIHSEKEGYIYTEINPQSENGAKSEITTSEIPFKSETGEQFIETTLQARSLGLGQQLFFGVNETTKGQEHKIYWRHQKDDTWTVAFSKGKEDILEDISQGNTPIPMGRDMKVRLSYAWGNFRAQIDINGDGKWDIESQSHFEYIESGIFKINLGVSSIDKDSYIEDSFSIVKWKEITTNMPVPEAQRRSVDAYYGFSESGLRYAGANYTDPAGNPESPFGGVLWLGNTTGRFLPANIPVAEFKTYYDKSGKKTDGDVLRDIYAYFVRIPEMDNLRFTIYDVKEPEEFAKHIIKNLNENVPGFSIQTDAFMRVAEAPSSGNEYKWAELPAESEGAISHEGEILESGELTRNVYLVAKAKSDDEGNWKASFGNDESEMPIKEIEGKDLSNIFKTPFYFYAETDDGSKTPVIRVNSLKGSSDPDRDEILGNKDSCPGKYGTKKFDGCPYGISGEIAGGWGEGIIGALTKIYKQQDIDKEAKGGDMKKSEYCQSIFENMDNLVVGTKNFEENKEYVGTLDKDDYFVATKVKTLDPLAKSFYSEFYCKKVSSADFDANTKSAVFSIELLQNTPERLSDPLVIEKSLIKKLTNEFIKNNPKNLTSKKASKSEGGAENPSENKE